MEHRKHGLCAETEKNFKYAGKIWVSTTNGSCAYQCLFCDCIYSSASSFELHIPNEHSFQRQLVAPPQSQPHPLPKHVDHVETHHQSRFDRALESHPKQNNSNSNNRPLNDDRHAAAQPPPSQPSRFDRGPVQNNNLLNNIHKRNGFQGAGFGRRNSINIERVRRESRDHRPNKHVKSEREKFLCTLCGNEFGHLETLRDHIRRNHSFQCTYCVAVETITKNNSENDAETAKSIGKTFETEKGLWSHQRNHHRNHFPYKCDVCPRAFASKPLLKQHMESKHARGNDVKCDFCPKMLMSTFQKKNHIARSHSNRRYYCSLCTSYSTNSNDNLKRHTKEKHPGQEQGNY